MAGRREESHAGPGSKRSKDPPSVMGASKTYTGARQRGALAAAADEEDEFVEASDVSSQSTDDEVRFKRKV